MSRLFTILVLASAAWSQPVEVPSPITECWCNVTPKRFHDADTIPLADIHLPFGVTLNNVTLRAADYDAKEVTRTRKTVEITEAEIIDGKRAAREFEEWCKSGQLQCAPPLTNGRDPYGRYRVRFRVVRGFTVEEGRQVAAKKKWLRTKAGE